MHFLFLQGWFSEQLLKAIGWTLIHSLWQGLLAAVLAGLIIMGTKKSAARHRYNLLGAVLFLFIISGVITFLQQLNGSAGIGKTFTGSGVTLTGTVFMEGDAYNPGTGNTAPQRFVRFFNSNADFIVLIWAIFFLFNCIKLFTGLAGIQRMRQHRTHASPDRWQKKLEELSGVLGLKQTVILFQSGLIKVPVAIGFFKPVILVPLGLLSNLPAEQVETILLHELAHIRRKDYFVNIMQRFTEAVFFFNPALLWISSLVRQEREACCDDIVLANTTHKGTYLQALVSFQEYSFAAARYAMAIKSKKHYLLNRVKRMVTQENKKLGIMEKIFLVAGLASITAFTFIPIKDAPDKRIVAAGSISYEQPSVASIQEKPTNALHIQKAIVKRQHPRVLVNAPVIIFPRDTVPPKKENEKEKTGETELKFPSVSSNIHDDGKTKTETATAIDGNGKKYTYTKVNDKITSLVIDGRNIPENEFDNYSQLLDKIEMLRQENKARRLENIEQRKLFQAQRPGEFKNRAEQQNLQRKFLTLQKQYLQEQYRQSRKIRESGEKLENKRKDVIRLIRQLKEKKSGVPMLNGREIIKSNIHSDISVQTQLLVDANLNNQQAIQKMADLNKKDDSRLRRNLFLKGQIYGPVKSGVKLEINKQLHYD